ncbi:hypothetical protein H4R34_000191 [Dimargaris verticillata]|uniref:Peptidase S54 rhomboid domain-containing protein n=1 Tax=Dimargaris verticillata TaxID=2761393 RepID=A0A9W8EC25_9FUNG|nr:hypothetical protein H4R34_000191 [Dimargaris verticillata]
MPTKATTPLGPLRLAIRTYSRKRHALVDARKTYAPKYNRFGTTEHNAKIVIFSILGLNALVYLCWGIGQERLRLAGDDHFIGFMQRHFVTSLANYEEHRYWTLLTSCFSQMTTIHLAFNMFALYSFGVPVVQLMGARPFLIFYTLAGITSSIVSLVGQRFRMTMGNPRTVNRQSGSVGASGAVLATLTLFAMVYPSSKILLVFIPVNSQAAIAVLAAYDLVNLFKNPNSLIDSAGHLGGTMFGLGYYYLLLKPLITRL